MRKLALLLFIIPIFGFGQELSQLRLDYPKADNDKAVTEQLFEQLSSVSKESEVLLNAFKGAVTTLKAKHTKGISNKKKLFKQGVELLEYAISTKPKSIEIRCLRLGVQENSPKIVGYKDAIKEDKQFILDNFKSVSDPEIKKFVGGYVQISDLFSEAEKQLF